MPESELVSPELVLVDPELAQRVRPTVPLRDCLVPRSRAFGDAPSRSAAMPASAGTLPARRRRGITVAVSVRNAILTMSLFVNGLLIASWWSGPGSEAPLSSAPSAAEPSPSGLARMAEANVLSGLDRNSTLRRLFVDARTGIVLPGVSAQCGPPDRSGAAGVIRCLVWRQQGGARIARHVDYRPGSGPVPRLTLVDK